MTKPAITPIQEKAIKHLLAECGHNPFRAATAHRNALLQGGWGAPTVDMSVLNSLSDQDMVRGLVNGRGVQTDIPAQLTITSEQETALEAALASAEHDVDALVFIHRTMLAHGGWTTPGRVVLNELSERDIRGVFSDACQVTVGKPRPVILNPHKNGYPLTAEQVDAIEGWFARPENLTRDREDFLRMMKDDPQSNDLVTLPSANPRNLALVLYVGYQPI